MFSRLITGLLAVLLVLPFQACSPDDDELVLYSGRSQALVNPIVDRFEEETGLSVTVRYGDTAQLAVALQEEGDRTRADLFWGQDAGALGAIHAAGRLVPLPDSIQNMVSTRYVNDDETWIATSGRARTLAYAPQRVDVDELPDEMFDLSDERFEGRVGWAPTNGSFQSHVTAIRKLAGDDATRQWLEDMDGNGTKSYANNTAIVQGLADGEIDLGLPNHYYLYRFLDDDPDFPVEQTFFEPGDAGNLVNVAGAGVISTTNNEEAAFRFLAFLLAEESQQYFVNEVYEYPVIEGVAPREELQELGDLDALQPELDLDELRDLQETLDMLRDVGLL